MKHLKRYVIDTVGNYLFFVPLVVAFTPSLRSWDGAQEYALAAVPISLIGSRTFTYFLRYWYRLCREEL